MVQLKPHQIKAVKQMHNGCVLKGGVGSGKTFTSLAYYLEREAPRDIYVITTARKRDTLDWEQEASHFGIGKEASVAGKLHVDSWNNIEKYSGVEGAFFIFDEQRAVGRGVWSKVLVKISKANRWVMLSATPGDAWIDYVPLFIANGFHKNRSQFMARHAVVTTYGGFPKIERYVDEAYLYACRKAVLVEMPYERHTTRHVHETIVDYDQEKWDTVTKKRWNYIDDCPIEDVSQLFVLMRKTLNSDVSRLGAMMEILEKHPKVIVFYNFDYELDLLRGLVRTLEIDSAEWNGHKHQPVPDSDRWLYLVQYTAGAEGWNCIETDTVAFWSLNYSFKMNEQARGRIDRLNTRFVDLHYYVLMSRASLDRAIWKAILFKRDFNEAQMTF